MSDEQAVEVVAESAPAEPEIDLQLEAEDPPEVEAAAEPAADTTQESAPEQVDAEDKTQKRINQLVAQRYEEKRRADALEKQLQEQAAKPEPEPTLEKFDYDEEAYNKAAVAYQVKQEILALQKQAQAQQALQQQQEINRSFAEKVQKFARPDYAEVISAIPELPNETIGLVQQAGPEVAYYLGKHLDVAAEIAQSNPLHAAMRIGAITEQLKAGRPNKQPSTAPEPIKPLSAAGALSGDVGDDMSMEAWMAKYG
jgi:hypothetical protein